MQRDFTREDLRVLVDLQVPPCVSIYLPADHKGTLAPRNAIHLRSLLQQAEERLQGSTIIDKGDLKTMFEPAYDFLNQEKFWANQWEGVAVFFSAMPDSFRHYTDVSTAIEFREQVFVGNSFHFKPLMPLLRGDGLFYVLAVSKDHVGLLRCTRDTVRPVELPGVPMTIEEALGEEIAEPQMVGRPTNMGGGGQTAPFGGFDPGKYSKDRVQRFLREVAEGVQKVLGASNAPLVFAGFEYMHPIYKEANLYPYYVENGIHENAETLDANTLRIEGWKIVEPIFRKDREDCAEKYRQFAHTERATDKLAEIVPAAHYARVETLFVALDSEQYGKFDAKNNRLELHNDQRNDNVELYNLAATQAAMNGAAVFVVPPEQMPDHHASIAAIMRY